MMKFNTFALIGILLQLTTTTAISEDIVKRGEAQDCDPVITVYKSLTYTAYSTDMNQKIHASVGTTGYSELQLAPCALHGLPTSTITVTVPSATVTITSTA